MQNDDEGIYDVAQVIDRLTMKTKTRTETIDYDSDSKEEPKGLTARIHQLLKNLIGIPIRLKMTARGEILNIDIPDEEAEKLRTVGDALKYLHEKMGN